jgi:GrpB-like predicted nucleotidyltransferase (UPF0157 family)
MGRREAAQVGIEVVAADARWPVDFTALSGRIRDALGPVALQLAHVGSTSVPGLAAKPVVDIDLTVADPSDEATWLPPLEQAGFELVIREPWWHEHRVLVFPTPAAICTSSVRIAQKPFDTEYFATGYVSIATTGRSIGTRN